ncbi:PGL/p-HBAD biosynthesis glycosyltransferase [Pontiella desulfatans]|uniref:PGL/p-HBAD biosynthesis glycosyltransferase n=1 Tax=Pontiella desulfatans TaxID=2750659 RepID=A0A6C2U5Z2_PONDE|nr:glycosyltransferase family 2 protein [Pontiella desulfatans]VGO14816.1 PGL/p-HBAD biosynthesis glycosyltransferase [Pontiella desulfatans]
MKISIITATWNSEASIADTQRSLAEQEFPRDRIEWIVVDGASTDRTVETIKAGDFQPDKLVSEKDNGIYDALNKGVRMATGDFVGFLHADDFLASPGVLNRISCALENSGADALYGDLQYVRPQADGGFGVVRHWESGIYHRRSLARGWMPPHPTLYLKREIYERTKLETGEFFNTAYTCAADYDFMMRILGKYEVEPAYLRMVLVKMRVGGVSNRSLKHIIQKSREDWEIIRKNQIGGIHTLAWKNLGKLMQFVVRKP